MPLIAFSPEWAQALGHAIGESQEYRESGASWTGPILFRAGDRGVFLDLAGGICREARTSEEGDKARARIVLSASPAIWIQMLDGSLDPFTAVFRNDVAVEKGSLMDLAPHTRSAREIFQSAIRMGAVPPEAWSGPG